MTDAHGKRRKASFSAEPKTVNERLIDMRKTRGKYNQYTDYENYTMLSEKELEVLQLYNLGMQLSEISQKTGLKRCSVSSYLSYAAKKIEGEYDFSYREKYYKEVVKKRYDEDSKYRDKMKEYYREYMKMYSKTPKNRKYLSDYREKLKNREAKKGMNPKKKQNRGKGESKYSYEKAKFFISEREKGKTLAQIAEENGCTRQNVHQCINTYINYLDKQKNT